MWDGRVHERYGEACFYYIIRALDPTNTMTVSSTISQLLIEQDISSGSVYSLFGFYDVLLRVWFTETVRRRFLYALTTRSPQFVVDDIRDFRADQITYSFAERPSPSVDEIRNLDPQIRRVNAAELNDTWGEDPEDEKAFDDLVENGCVHRVPATAGVKFYLVCDRTMPRVNPPEYEQQRILNSVLNSGLECISLYSGKGTLADYLIKGVVSDFSQLYDRITPVRREARDLHLRSMTLPIAHIVDDRETDNVDELRVPAKLEIDELVEELGHDYSLVIRAALRKAVDSLPEAQSRAISELHKDIAPEFRGTPFYSKYLATLRGSLRNDVDELDGAVSFFNAIERDLRYLIPRILAEQLGGADASWHKVLEDAWNKSAEAADELTAVAANEDFGADEDQPLRSIYKRLTMRGLLDFLRLASTKYPQLTDFFSRSFYDGWEEDIRPLWETRNRVNHGRFLDRTQFTDFDDSWGEDLRKLYRGGRLYNALQRLRQIY